MQIENYIPDLAFSKETNAVQDVTWERSSLYSVCFEERSTYYPPSDNDCSLPHIEVFGDYPLDEEFYQSLADLQFIVSFEPISKMKHPAYVARKKARRWKRGQSIGVFGYGKQALAALYACITFPDIYQVGVIHLSHLTEEEGKKYRSLLHFHALLDKGMRRQTRLLLILPTNTSKSLLNSLLKIGVDFDLQIVSEEVCHQRVQRLTKEYFVG